MFSSELVSGNMNTENKENVSQMNSQEDKGSPNLKTDEVKNKIDAALALGKRAIIGKVPCTNLITLKLWLICFYFRIIRELLALFLNAVNL